MLTVLLNPKKLDSHLDPISIPYTNDFYLLENLTVKLLSLDEKGNYQLDLAKSIKPLSETSYLISIKESYFSNGNLISAEDVKETILRSAGIATSHTILKDLIETVEVINKSELRVDLKKPVKSFFYYLSLPDFGILHRNQYRKSKLVAHDFVEVSSGPFSYMFDGKDYFLIKNSGYKLSENSYFEKVKLLSYFEKNPLNLITEGKADLGKISVKYFLENRESIQKNTKLKVIGSQSSSLTYLFFNKHSKKFKNSRWRNYLKRKVLENLEIPQSLGWMARKSYQYFPPESEAFLSENDFLQASSSFKVTEKPKDFPNEILIHTYTTVYNVTIESLVRQLERINGVKIRIVNDVEPNEFLSSMKEGKFDIFLNVMSTDFRMPLEAINFEFFGEEAPLEDLEGIVSKNYNQYQLSGQESGRDNLIKISKFLAESDQVIPMFHSAIPYLYNSERINLKNLNHLFIFNFWKISKDD